jgi:glycosyltransferase involved in cell wall biosynthesis
MRIAMVGPFGLHPNKTMRSRALQLARPLVRRGHQARLLMPPWHTPEEAGQEWQEDGVEMQYIELSGGVLGTAARMVRETQAWKPDVVHTFKPKAYSGLTAWWLWNFRRRSQRLVTDTDDWEGSGGWNELAPYSAWQKRFFAWQEGWGIRHCHALTVASRTLQSMAWAHGVKPERVVYLPNGPGISGDSSQAVKKRADLDLARRPVILVYSRFFEFDSARLMSVLEQVHAVVPDLAILLVGLSLYEDDDARFRDQLAAANLRDALVDMGWVEEAVLPHLLASADVGLYLMDDTLLNRTKCPVKLADMLQVGLPVVAENVGQVSEYVLHRKTGLLRASGDVNGLAEDLIWLLQNPEERNGLGAGARAHIEARFTWECLADVAETAYDVAMTQKDR